MTLSNSDISDLIDFRHMLHRRPELSGEEAETARSVVAFLAPTRPDRVVTGLGGHGVAAVYESGRSGPTVMFRSELDALPIFEITDVPHRSEVAGKAHLCGHDGHSAILLGLARRMARARPKSGRVVLLFQPAEENGAGAAAVLADRQFESIRPDWSFAIHNMPGCAIGHARLAAGPANCASRGLRIVLSGRTAHASMPETGVSPTMAAARLIGGLPGLGPGGCLDEDFRLVTLTHARIGEQAFGVAPGHAEVWVTLRTLTDDGMGALTSAAEEMAGREADAAGLGLTMTYHDVFHACHNDAEATRHLGRALEACGITFDAQALPMRGSEDFGLFGSVAKSAMVFLGAGEDHPMVHNPDYDFPDQLIVPGVRLFEHVLRGLLDEGGAP